VLTIALVRQLPKTIQDKPQIVSLIWRLVLQTVVSTVGQGTGLDSAAAIIGARVGVTWPIWSLPIPASRLGASRCLEPAEVAPGRIAGLIRVSLNFLKPATERAPLVLDHQGLSAENNAGISISLP
jgi:hypothetical protein